MECFFEFLKNSCKQSGATGYTQKFRAYNSSVKGIKAIPTTESDWPSSSHRKSGRWQAPML